MRTMFDPACRDEVLRRLRRLDPAAKGRWGRMTAPQMVAHLTDQMGHTLGDRPAAPRPGFLRWPILRKLWVYCLPWPKGRAKGPPEAYVTEPAEWAADVAALEALVERFAARNPKDRWPEHALFGPMTGRAWGRFCWRHFDYHLRQFGE